MEEITYQYSKKAQFKKLAPIAFFSMIGLVALIVFKAKSFAHISEGKAYVIIATIICVSIIAAVLALFINKGQYTFILNNDGVCLKKDGRLKSNIPWNDITKVFTYESKKSGVKILTFLSKGNKVTFTNLIGDYKLVREIAFDKVDKNKIFKDEMPGKMKATIILGANAAALYAIYTEQSSFTVNLVVFIFVNIVALCVVYSRRILGKLKHS